MIPDNRRSRKNDDKKEIQGRREKSFNYCEPEKDQAGALLFKLLLPQPHSQGGRPFVPGGSLFINLAPLLLAPQTFDMIALQEYPA